MEEEEDWEQEEGDCKDSVKSKEEIGNSLKCICTNIRSIMNNEKREELQCILVERKIAVLGITESLTKEEISDAEIKMIECNVSCKDRNCKSSLRWGKKRGRCVAVC